MFILTFSIMDDLAIRCMCVGVHNSHVLSIHRRQDTVNYSGNEESWSLTLREECRLRFSRIGC